MAKKLTRDDVESILADVPEQYVFNCRDGKVLRNVRELRDALLTMTDETFFYHSNDIKHDFSDWVRDIIKDNQLARDLVRSTTRLQAAKITVNRTALLSSKLGTKEAVSV